MKRYLSIPLANPARGLRHGDLRPRLPARRRGVGREKSRPRRRRHGRARRPPGQ